MEPQRHQEMTSATASTDEGLALSLTEPGRAGVSSWLDTDPRPMAVPEARSERAATTRQAALLTGVRCYYADGGGGHVERPLCESVGVVAYGNIVLCAMCKAMRSAVGRGHGPRSLPGAELIGLVEGALDLTRAEQRLDHLARSARAAGASWAQIGDALSMSRQAAQQRFGAPEGSGD